jgi:zinc D-Ala-D-Ala carboxypeptidase
MGNQILDLIKQLMFSFLSNEVQGKTEASVTIPLGVPKEEPVDAPKEGVPGIDWNDPTSKISKHFTVREALWLPSWQVLHKPSEDEKTNILKQALKMDLIREFLGVPVNIHCWIRPVLNNPESIHHGQDYNALVKGAKNSAHKIGLATDYDAQGLNCDDVRAKLVPKLDEWEIRMEKMPGGNWVHNDCAPVIAYRYFNP